jgi:hypothetical protein
MFKGLKKSALPLLTIALVLLFQIGSVVTAVADEIVISGNGEGSSNEVSVQNNSTTTVTQTNSADVTNNVDTSATTGNNTASDNTGGGTSIVTGDATQDLSIQNSLNSSSVEIECCPTGTTIEISGNGSDSENSVSLENGSQTNVSINQYASVTNNVSGTANTGDNKANDNTGGSVLIDTGNIKVLGGIKNGPINFYSIMGGSGTGGNLDVTINSNGSGSTNLVSLLLGDLTNLWLYNNALIHNEVYWDLNTGGNEANGNTGGDVTIRTGDILFDFMIENGPINVGGVDWGCCEPPDDGDGGPTPTPPPPGGDPHDPGPGSSGPGSSGPGSSGVILALAETSGDGFPMVLLGLAMIAAGASLVKKQKFV